MPTCLASLRKHKNKIHFLFKIHPLYSFLTYRWTCLWVYTLCISTITVYSELTAHFIYSIAVLEIWSSYCPTVHNHLCSWNRFFVHLLLHSYTPLVIVLHSNSAALHCTELKTEELHCLHRLFPFIGMSSVGKTQIFAGDLSLPLQAVGFPNIPEDRVMYVQARWCSPFQVLRDWSLNVQ